jgi:hypothetical protein
VNLRSYFNDAEDGPAGLVYTIVGNTNPALFASASIDAATDVLVLDYAQDASGIARITIRATDSGGFHTETTFTVTVLSAAQQAQNLAAVVETLPLNAGNRNALAAKLDLKGNNGDSGKVGAFMNTVQALAKNGKLSHTNSDLLLSPAGDLLVSLS